MELSKYFDGYRAACWMVAMYGIVSLCGIWIETGINTLSIIVSFLVLSCTLSIIYILLKLEKMWAEHHKRLDELRLE